MNIDRTIALAVVTTLTAVTLLALKSRFLNQRLIALAKQFRLHHLLALAAAAGMLIHTAMAFWRDWPDSLSLYFTLSDLPTVAGWLALILFMIVIVSSWLPRIAWKHWYLLHLLSLPAFVATARHSLIYARTRPADFVLLIALFTLLTLGIVRALSDRFSPAHSAKFTVQKNLPVAEGISELHLAAVSGQKPESFPAGSIVYLRFVGRGFSRQWHPFSVASCRFENDLRLLVKGLGTDTAKMGELHMADLVLIRGPFREFIPDFSREQIWIAGGIGIAPFAGYAACLSHFSASRVTVFHWYERSAQQIKIQHYAGHITSTLLQIDQLVPPHTEPDLTRLIELARGKDRAQFIVCGPPAFMRLVRRSLRRTGIDSAQIETEEFLPW